MSAGASTTLPGTPPPSAPVPPVGWADDPAVVAVVFALKTFLAGLLALFLEFWLELDEPRWALLTVFIVSQPDSGLVLAKGFHRILGTIGGLLVSIVLVFGLSQYGDLFLAAVALWIALCTFAAGALRNFASYGFLLAGYSVAVVGIPAAVHTDQAFPILLARFTEIILGIVCASLVSRLVFPRDLMPKLVALVHALRLRAERLGAAITRLDWQDLAGERRQFLADFAAVETTRASAYRARLLVGSRGRSPDRNKLRWLSMQLVCGFRDLATLIASALEFVRRRQARAIAAGDRSGSVW